MSNEEKIKIIPLKNGPYRVESLQKFTNSRNELIAVKKKMILCRCGASHNKPFCDGTHTKTGFSDEKREDRMPDRRDGGYGVRAEDAESLRKGLREALAYKGPALVEIISDPQLI